MYIDSSDNLNTPILIHVLPFSGGQRSSWRKPNALVTDRTRTTQLARVPCLLILAEPGAPGKPAMTEDTTGLVSAAQTSDFDSTGYQAINDPVGTRCSRFSMDITGVTNIATLSGANGCSTP